MENTVSLKTPHIWESLLDKPRVYVDLNSGGQVGDTYIVPLNKRGTVADLQRRNIVLQEGLSLDFWTDDGDDAGDPDPLLFSGHLHFDGQTNQWIAVVPGDEFVHASQIHQTPKIESVTVHIQEVKMPRGKKQQAVPKLNKHIL